MNGELDFEQSLRERVKLLKGTPATVFEDLKSVITFTPGARELCKVLKSLGFKMAVLSGGFIPLALYVKSELGLDYAYANQVTPPGPDTLPNTPLTATSACRQRRRHPPNRRTHRADR